MRRSPLPTPAGRRVSRAYDHRQIDRFCEGVLLKAGREEEAYRNTARTSAPARPTLRSTATPFAAIRGAISRTNE